MNEADNRAHKRMKRQVSAVIYAGAVLFVVFMFSSCSSNEPTTVQPLASGTQNKNITTASIQQTVKSSHKCVTTELSQMYVEDSVRLTFGEGNTYLGYCFASGYQGIGCGDNWQITHALGHGLSNRERAKCDEIMSRLERHEAAEESRKHRLDEAYDKQHGLKPAQ